MKKLNSYRKVQAVSKYAGGWICGVNPQIRSSETPPRSALTLPPLGSIAAGILTLSAPFRLPLLAWCCFASPWAQGSGRCLPCRGRSILRAHWLSFQPLVELEVVSRRWLPGPLALTLVDASPTLPGQAVGGYST